jgi:hypothetical protein
MEVVSISLLLTAWPLAAVAIAVCVEGTEWDDGVVSPDWAVINAPPSFGALSGTAKVAGFLLAGSAVAVVIDSSNETVDSAADVLLCCAASTALEAAIGSALPDTVCAAALAISAGAIPAGREASARDVVGAPRAASNARASLGSSSLSVAVVFSVPFSPLSRSSFPAASFAD